MKKLLLPVFFVLAAPISALAQDRTQVEVFEGYSYLRRGFNTNGWETSLLANINSPKGNGAGFSGDDGSVSAVAVKKRFFLFGPKFTYRGNNRFTPVGHAVFGAEHAKADAFRVSGASVPTAASEIDLVGPGASLAVTGLDAFDLRKRTDDRVAPNVELRERLIVDLSSGESSLPVSFTETANSFRAPGSTQSQAQAGQKSKKGPLITALVGLGLVGAGAYFIATPNPPKTVGELFDEGRIDRRYHLGVPMVTLGAVLALLGFTSMR